MCALAESNHIGASFYLHAIFFQVYHSCTRCAKYTADKQSCHLHVHRGMQDATSEIFKPYLFTTFSGFTTSLFALHPYWIVHFLTLGLLHHTVLVNVGGLEPPLTEPKSVVLPLHYTSFIGLSRLSELRNLRVQLVPHVCPSVRWYESLRFVLWAGLEPASQDSPVSKPFIV